MANPMSVDNSSDVTAMFNNMSAANTSSSSAGEFNLADYSSIKNGTYKKVLNAYYAQNAKKTTTDTEKSLSQLKLSADSLKESAEALSESSTLFEKKLMKKKDEKTGEEVEVMDYDREAIAKAVNSFVKDYNSFLDAAGKSDTKGVLQKTLWMTNMTKKNANLLGDVGIKIGKGNKLEVDEKALGEANIITLKNLFSGPNSFADKVARKGGQISNEAAGAIAKMMKTYSSNGTIPKVEASGNFYDSSL